MKNRALLFLLALILLSSSVFALKTIDIKNLKPEEIYRLEVDQHNLALTNVKFSVTRKLPATNVTMQFITQNSAPLKLRDTYRYFRIAATGMDEDKYIENAEIEFKVESSWFRLEEYVQDAVKLHVYDNGEWIELPTQPTGIVSGEVYFKSDSYMFGYFAVTSKKIEELNITEPGEEVTRQEVVYRAPLPLTFKDILKTIPNQVYYIIVGFIVSVAIFLVGFSMINKGKHPYPELAKYINNSLHKGADIHEIRQVLLSAGWPKKVVDEELCIKK